VSKALARLRAELNDALLVRRGDRMILTPRAERLANPLGGALSTLGKLLHDSGMEARPRTVSIAMRDQFVVALTPALMRELAAASPETTLNIVPYERDRLVDDLARGTVDLAVAVDPPNAPDLIGTLLYRERFVCLTPERQPPTPADYASAWHVATTSHIGYSGIDAALARKGCARRIAAHVPYFAALVHVAESQGLFATLPLRVVEALKPRKLFVHALPIAVPGFRVSMVWHRRCDQDAENRWLRGLLRRAAQSTEPVDVQVLPEDRRALP
jgi:DNA-binding transcriptional LysR family regulator